MSCRPSKKPQAVLHDYHSALIAGLANLIFQRIKHGSKRHQRWLKKRAGAVAAEWYQ